MKKDMPREVVVRMGSEHSKRLMDKSAYTGNSEMNTRFITTKKWETQRQETNTQTILEILLE